MVETQKSRRFEQERGVVVALLHVVGEGAGLVEQPADPGHSVGPEEREAERLDRVPRELVGHEVADDLRELNLRV